MIYIGRSISPASWRESQKLKDHKEIAQHLRPDSTGATLAKHIGDKTMENDTKQLGARIRTEVLDSLRALSKKKRISMAVLTEQAIIGLLEDNGIEVSI